MDAQFDSFPKHADDPAPGVAGSAWAQAAARRIDRQLAIFDKLFEAGAESFETVIEDLDVLRGQGCAGNLATRAATLSTLTRSQECVARGLRMTAALTARLHHEREWIERVCNGEVRQRAAHAAEVRKAKEETREVTTQLIIERIAAENHPGDSEAAGKAVDAACLRLRERETFGDLLGRPISQTIDHLCGLLGLAPDWPRRFDEAWAQQEIARGDTGPPLKEMIRQREAEARHRTDPVAARAAQRPPDLVYRIPASPPWPKRRGRVRPAPS